MDADDLNEAIEGAAFLDRDNGRTVASPRQVDRFRDQLRRLFDELPAHVTVQEIRELLEPDAGEAIPED